MKTKNNRKKNFTKIISYLSFALLITLMNCKSDDTPTDCGCNSEIITTIPENPITIGQISFKEQLDVNDIYYTEKYWIGFVEPNCSNCIHHMIVCNEDFIPNEIKTLINTNGIININFSGYLKEICEKTFDVAGVTYQRITLTKIELQ